MLRLLMCVPLAHAAAHAADSGQWRPAGTGRARRARRACCAEPCRAQPRPFPFMDTAYGRLGSLADPAFDRGGDCGVHGFKCVASLGLYGKKHNQILCFKMVSQYSLNPVDYPTQTIRRLVVSAPVVQNVFKAVLPSQH
jgi:hypothetical protein